jgi:hypothetical protein
MKPAGHEVRITNAVQPIADTSTTREEFPVSTCPGYRTLLQLYVSKIMKIE